MRRPWRILAFVLVALLGMGAVGVYLWYSHITQPPGQIDLRPGEIQTIPGARMAAEWEPAQGLLIAWPLRLPEAFVRDVVGNVELVITVKNATQQDAAKALLQAWGISGSRFVIVEQGDGYYGTRDWGPHAVFDSDGRQHLVDARYLDYPASEADSSTLFWLSKLAGLGFEGDDRASKAVARRLGRPILEAAVALTGGSVETDGQGTAILTKAVLEENEALGVPRDLFLSRLEAAYGLRRVIVLPKYEVMGVHHVDCLLKLLDEERVLVKRPPADHDEFAAIEKIVAVLTSEKSVKGTPYRVFRIDTPRYDDEELANYTNTLILNATVYVPLFGIDADEAALRRWRELMPSYEVRGYGYDGEHGWTYTDALHCRTKAVWAAKRD